MAQRLHSLRRAKGWSQERLAGRAGVAVKTVQGIERDDHEPKLFTVICLADALGVTLDYLVTGREEA